MKEELTEIELISTTDEYEINQICSLLENNEIPFIRRDDGSGSYMNLYFGQSIQAKRVFVRKVDYDKAFELISAFSFNLSKDSEEEIQKTEEMELKQDDEEQKEAEKKYSLIRKGFGFLFIIIPIIIVAILILMQG